MKGPLRRVIAKVDASTVVLDCGHGKTVRDLQPWEPVRARCLRCRTFADQMLQRLNLTRQPRVRLERRRREPPPPSFLERAREIFAVLWWGLR